jgi:uncharacterized protein (TIGR02284 family)
MKSAKENTIDTLNDLIKINNDRVEGYEKAIQLTSDEDADLKALFNSMINESRDYRSELENYVNSLGETDTPTGTRTDGKIYRAWMSVRSTFSGKDRRSVLASCEGGEDAAQRAYESALKEDLTDDATRLVTEQKSKLRQSHDKIKALRDMQHADHHH